METQISSKLAAFVAALMVSSLIMGGVAYLLEGGMQQPSLSVAIAHLTSLFAHATL
jgi:hypothetical protein